MPRRAAILTQTDLTRACRAAANAKPRHCVRVLPDGGLLLLPLDVVDIALPAAAAPPAATEPAALA